MGKLPVAREGWPFIAIPGAIALGLALLGHRRLALPFAAAAAASAGFFRDPERAIPVVANGVLAPADGRVLSVEDAVDPFVGPAVRVAIFLSPLDVHVNRAPIAGVVTDTVYTPGRFAAAYDATMEALGSEQALARGLDPSGHLPLRKAKAMRRNAIFKGAWYEPERLVHVAQEQFGLPQLLPGYFADSAIRKPWVTVEPGEAVEPSL